MLSTHSSAKGAVRSRSVAPSKKASDGKIGEKQNVQESRFSVSFYIRKSRESISLKFLTVLQNHKIHLLMKFHTSNPMVKNTGTF